MNVFVSLWQGLNHLATQARRLGDAFGAMADQAEQRGGEKPTVAPALPEAKRVNGRLPKPVHAE